MIDFVGFFIDKVENFVGNGNNSGNQPPFPLRLRGLLSYGWHEPLCSFQEAESSELVSYVFTTLSQLLTTLKKKPFENIVGKGENADIQHFLLFPQCFLPIPKRMTVFKLLFFVIYKI